MAKISVHGGATIAGQQPPVTAGWGSAAGWAPWDVVPVDGIDNTLTLDAVSGYGTATGSGGAGNERRLVERRDFVAYNCEVRADLRITAGSPGGGQTGLFVRRGLTAPLCWTNVIFGASGNGIMGAWEFNGVDFLDTHQQAASADLYFGGDITSIDAGSGTALVTTSIPHEVTAGEFVHFDSTVGGFGQVQVATVPSSTTFTFTTATTGNFSGGRFRWVIPAGWRTMAVRIEDDVLKAKQWRRSHPEPDWDDPVKVGVASLGSLASAVAGRAGIVVAHLGDGGRIDVDNFTALSLDPQPEQGNWDTLANIAREARGYADDERSRPPVACPNDGEPLETGPDGTLHCRWDGWVWQG